MQNLDREAFNMDNFKIKTLSLGFTSKKSFIFQFLLADIFPKKARIFQVSFNYIRRFMRVSRACTPSAGRGQSGHGQIRQPCPVEDAVFLLHLDCTEVSHGNSSSRAWPQKTTTSACFWMSLQCPNSTYLLIKNSRVFNKITEVRCNGHCILYKKY